MTKKTTKIKLTEALASTIKTEYVHGIELETGEIVRHSIDKLVKKYNVAQTTLYRRARKEGWKQQREQHQAKLEEELSQQRIKNMAKQSMKFDDKSLSLATDLINQVGFILKKNQESIETKKKTYPPSQLLSLANTALTAQKLAKLALGEATEKLDLNANINETEAFRSALELLDTLKEQRRESDSKAIH